MSFTTRFVFTHVPAATLRPTFLAMRRIPSAQYLLHTFLSTYVYYLAPFCSQFPFTYVFKYSPRVVLSSSPQNLLTFLLRDSHQRCLHPLIHPLHRRRRGNTSDQSRRTSSGWAFCPFFSASSCCRILRDILSRKIHPHSERRSITR